MCADTLKSVKSRRTVRRGRLTTLKHQLDETSKQDLRHIEPATLDRLKKSLERESGIHLELQTHYEELLAKKEEANEDQTVCTEEIESGAEHQDIYEQYLETINNLIFDYELYKEADRLMAAYNEWAAVANPTARTFIQDGKDFISKIDRYLERSERRATSDVINSGCISLRALSRKTHQQINNVKEIPDKTDSSSSERYHKPSKFDIDLPSFHGSPTEWKQFYTLFSTTIEKRGKGLTSEERCCLLLKSLKDPQARELAQLNTSGDDGYEKAIAALLSRYGQNRVVLPHHITTFKAPRQYSFNRESLLQYAKEHITTYEALRAMEVDLSTFMAAYSVTLFDHKLAEEWGKHAMTLSSLPTMEDMKAYVQSLICNLPAASPTTSSAAHAKSHDKGKHNATVKTDTKVKPAACIICNNGLHSLSRCPTFRDYTPEKRGKVVREKKWCANCLHYSHGTQHCTSTFTCRHCGGKHHTLLHRGDTNHNSPPASNASPATTSHNFISVGKGKPSPSQNTTEDSPPTHAFLNTAMVKASSDGRSRVSRLALDAGSSSSLITEALASQLRLKRFPHRLSLVGAYSEGASKHYVKVTLTSLHDEAESITLKLSVVSKLPCLTPPARATEIASDENVRDLQLADSQFGGRLDILLGCLDICKCFRGQFKYFPKPDIAVSPTIFGWTVAGPMDMGQTSKFLSIQTSEDDLQQSLQRLWELEQVPDAQQHTPAEDYALQQFENQHSTDESGRYIVSLPRTASPPELGKSKATALSRFHQNEKSLTRKGKLLEFNNSLWEYKLLDHAEQVPYQQLDNDSYYLPVHGVFKASSTTTKVRPVFDASAKSSNGVSLNDLLLAGPNLYPLLTDILLQFRTHNIGFSADISKMFREILLDVEERDLHRFLMRNEHGKLIDYRMKRLTFGVKSSPFLATKVLHDLAEKHSTTHPIASQAILNFFYVDDFLSGAQSVREAVHIREQICELLTRAGMTLRKWRTSCPEFAASIPEPLRETDNLIVSEAPKALGIHWDVQKDSFNVATPDISTTKKVTKRLIASISAQVYDILGFFSPFSVRSKLLLQQLWKDGCGWDEEVSSSILQQWNEWTEELPLIHGHSIPRRYYSGSSTILCSSLHGFSDASTLAYGAVVYLRQQLMDGSISTAIVISKARVAPLKATTIPRAELVAAHLLSKLLIYSAKLLCIPLSQVHAWTDSTIVLCWLRKMPSTLHTFIANRVSFIQTNLPEVPWKHVPTKQNPADLLSRGVSSSTLSNDSLWWHGPPWLSLPPEEWVSQEHLIKALPKTLPEQKAVVVLSMVANNNSPNNNNPSFSLWSRFSSFYTLTRIVAWIKRFTSNCKLKADGRNINPQLTSPEIKSSKTLIIKISQQDSYPEISSHKKTTTIPLTHPLAKLNVFKDEDGIIKVSGRVRQDNGREAKTAIALSLKSPTTRLFIQSAHHSYLHPGVSTLLAILSEDYYIPGLKNYLKRLSRNCAVCQKAYARTIQPSMGLLPPERTNPSPPFYNTGLDFAGPFILKKGHTRKPAHIKAYVCVFVCFATKAIHLELCSDLTTEAFLATLRRFCARRGSPANVYSDNGTNFVGAASDLRQCRHLLHSSKEEISRLCTTAELTWHFSPPRAPNFGGLWEAGVKQMKLLLKKQIAPHPLTFEEHSTVLAEVEAILNSRPIVPMDSTELTQDLVLTPGHFLIGRPLKSPARPNKSEANISSLRRWNLVQRMQQDLWLSWQGWYLQTLMRRAKWNKNSRIVKEGDIVLLKDEALTHNTNTWPLAKISRLFHGDDGIARAADVLCNDRTYRRSVGRLVPLFAEPINTSTTSINT